MSGISLPFRRPRPAEGAGAPEAETGRHRSWLATAAIAFAVLIVPVLLVAGLTVASGPAGKPSLAAIPVVSAEAFEAANGIKVDLIGVTAAGGLIQLRFTVTDEQKASLAFHSKETMPSLGVESRGLLINPPGGMAHHLKIVGGASYFVLYANPGGWVQAGTPVTVVVGNERLAPITAQS